MSTTKPRITLTLEPHAHEVLRRLSAAGGESMSAIVTGFLDMALPQLERLVVVMEQAKTMPEETKEAIRGSLVRAEAELLPSVMAVVDQADMFVAEAHATIKAAGRGATEKRPGRTLSGLSTPVPVTRGSGRTKAPHVVPSKGGRNG